MSCVFRKGDIVAHPKVNNRGYVVDVGIGSLESPYNDRKGTGLRALVEWDGTVTSPEPVDELRHFYHCECPS